MPEHGAVAESYIPRLARISRSADEAPLIKRFELEPLDGAFHPHRPGQFLMLSVFGSGEFPVSIPTAPGPGGLELCVKNVGTVTGALHRLGEGDIVGLRGPYGNGFPMEELEGKPVTVAAGGMGLAPLRSVILSVLQAPERFGALRVSYGARTCDDFIYGGEFEGWRSGGAEVHLTADCDAGGWTGRVGFVPGLMEELAPDPEGAVLVCGPTAMIKKSLALLGCMGYPDDRVYTTLEMRMKCGLGKCGRCNVGPLYVCRDGPVFAAKKLLEAGWLNEGDE